jgi:Arc/MetJ-type ribon-helix-helix transcriptional regulator
MGYFGGSMPASRSHVKVTATVPGTLLAQIDALVAAHAYPSRSAAIEVALLTLLRARMDAHIAAEAAKLDLADEQALADEGLDDYITLVGAEGIF